ncbi:MAG TPA: divalent-cation tolerance protein CutA [Burkholderiaceae bacterium]|nr:divalent-cation tolerance protein CutA [Burkholderiaceae bacterium]
MSKDIKLRREQVADNPQAPVVVLSTAPDNAVARHIAQALVHEGLAACVNLAPPSLSIYQWQGKVEEETEVALTIKTCADRLPALAERLSGLHPYEVPELLVLDVTGGTAAYLDWMHEQTRPISS